MLSVATFGDAMMASAAAVANRHDNQAPAMNMVAVAVSSTAAATLPSRNIWVRAMWLTTGVATSTPIGTANGARALRNG
jgi:hypothetical protein